ncbi:MAG: lipoprotein-releasing ABC transporter permease subunit [Chromatiales bacterium]|nr:lipoprotein-releasing ABC transporter permease subunit [Chromatiales bacterium]
MFRPLEAYIGLRYTRARRRNRYISFIAGSSMLGTALGVLALITVLSVMNGFEREIRDRMLSFASHVTVSGKNEELADWRELLPGLRVEPGVEGAAPFVEMQGMLTAGSAVSGALVRGIFPGDESRVSAVTGHMKAGSLDDLRSRGWGIILGAELARAMGLYLGDQLQLLTPQAQVTPAGILPRMKRFTVVGIFEIGINEYDRHLALIHAEDAARLLRIGDAVSGVRLRLGDLFTAPQVRARLQRELGKEYRVSDWSLDHATFFSALRLEKRMMFLILLLVVAVAAFNIVSTLMMVVTEKQSDIAILRTLGMSPGAVTRVFIVQGSVLGIVGTLLGTLAGVPFALNLETIVPVLEKTFGFHLFPPDVYYISQVPSQLQWSDVAIVVVCALALSLLATLYPARRAARVEPAEALGYD